MKRCIIYCEDIQYIENHVIPVVRKYTNLWKTYVGNESSEHLERFSNNEIEILIACGKLNEGVDIKSIQNIVMFSYTGNSESLVVTGRIGRALRISPRIQIRKQIFLILLGRRIPIVRNATC